MKQLLSILAGTLILLTTCGKPPREHFTIVNPTEIALTDFPLSIDRDAFDQEGTLTEIAEGKVPVFISAAGDTLPYQLDDLDGDDVWDACFLLVTLEPGAEMKINYYTSDASRVPKFSTRTNIRFANKPEPHADAFDKKRLASTATAISSKAFQVEGPAWENDKVAFRNYYDARNGMDIFGKRTSDMVMDGVGLGEDYHSLQEWGMDILKVGNSLGAGSIALKLGDSLYRVGPNSNGTFHLITEGPLRSIFELHFSDWEVQGTSYQVVHRISIWGGARYFKSEVTVTPNQDVHLVTGLVSMLADTFEVTQPNDHMVVMSTHDNQAFDGEKLGLAIITPVSDYIDGYEAPEAGTPHVDIVDTYLMELALSAGKPSTYYLYVGWEKENPGFANLDFFEDQVQQTAAELAAEVQINWQQP